MVLPELAGIGLTPHSAAKPASVVTRSGLSPAVTMRVAAVTTPMPWAASSAGAVSPIACRRLASMESISRSRSPHRVASCLRQRLVTACTSVESPLGRRRRNLSRRVLAGRGSYCSRTESGALTRIEQICCIAPVRALTADRRVVSRTRTASTTPSLVLGVGRRSGAIAVRAALIASRGSDLPRRRRSARFGRTTSTTVCPAARRCRDRPAP